MAARYRSGPVLTLEQLVVRYPAASDNTLDGLSFSLQAGERLALVGPSGCGKSTVARAVLQLLPQGSACGGGLSLCGQDPRQLKRSALRQLHERFREGTVEKNYLALVVGDWQLGERLVDAPLLVEHRKSGERHVVVKIGRAHV